MTHYDTSGRNPLFINAGGVADAELLLLAKHCHPSVAFFAQQLLAGKKINCRGDPLKDFTLMTFVDRFAYRNPKEKKATKKDTKVIKKKAYDPWGVKKPAVTSKEYLAKTQSEMPPDERCLHRFAQLKFQIKDEKVEDEWEYESVNSEEFDEIIDRFESGEPNEEFDVDFSQEFSAEKQKKKGGEKRKVESDGEDDEGDEDDEEEKRAFQRGGKDCEGEYGDRDVEMAANRFEAMLEDMEEEDTQLEKAKKQKTRKPKGFKKSRR